MQDVTGPKIPDARSKPPAIREIDRAEFGTGREDRTDVATKSETRMIASARKRLDDMSSYKSGRTSNENAPSSSGH